MRLQRHEPLREEPCQALGASHPFAAQVERPPRGLARSHDGVEGAARGRLLVVDRLRRRGRRAAGARRPLLRRGLQLVPSRGLPARRRRASNVSGIFFRDLALPRRVDGSVYLCGIGGSDYVRGRGRKSMIPRRSNVGVLDALVPGKGPSFRGRSERRSLVRKSGPRSR